MANNFKWFDTSPTEDSSRKKGALSLIGQGLQGIAAPFMEAYGNHGGYESLQMQQQRDQADLEFQKYLASKHIQQQELGIKKQEAGTNTALMSAWLKSQGIDPSTIIGGNQNPSQGNPSGQFVNAPPQQSPIPPGAMMSMAQGGYGDVQGNPLMSQASPQQGMMSQEQVGANNPFANMQPSFSGGKFSLKPQSNALNQNQATTLGQQLVSGSLTPSQLQGRGLARTQALIAAQQIDPNYNAAQADINYAANKVGASGLEKLYNNVKTFHDTFRKNADVLLNESEKFDRSKIPLINQAILKGKTTLTGDPEASRMLAAVNTVSAEYARLTNSPGASSSVISDSARHEAQQILAGWQNDGTIKGLLDPETGIMSIDANNRVKALEERRNVVRGVKSENQDTGSLATPSGVKFSYKKL